jgi:hypothetical protein
LAFSESFDNRQSTLVLSLEGIYNPSDPLEWAKAIARKNATGGLPPVLVREESPNWAGHGGW